MQRGDNMSWTKGTGVGYAKVGENEDYVIDAKASHLRVHAFASGLIAAVAHSPKFEIREWMGETQLSSNNLDKGPIRITVNPSALDLVDEVRESERREIYRVMHSEVLETSKFPEIVFDGQWRVADHPGRDQYTVNVEGSLRLHGVTSTHMFEARVTLGPDSFRAHGEFIVFQREYGINTASIAGSALRLRDELKFSFFVVGRKKA